MVQGATLITSQRHQENLGRRSLAGEGHGRRKQVTLDIACCNTYNKGMNAHLRDEIRQTRPFSGPEQEAFLSLGRTWSLLDHAMAEMLKPHAITPTQFNVLRILRGAGEAGLCRADIIARMIARVPDATRLLDPLEAAGMVARERGIEDRRFVTTRITAEGRRLLDELEEPVSELHRLQFSPLSAEEIESLIGLLARLRESA